MIIRSNIANYGVKFTENLKQDLERDLEEECCFVVDKKVYDLYKDELSCINTKNVYLLEATEGNKTMTKAQELIKYLLEKGFKRDHKLIAIGGGITQDLTCFVASIMFRGVEWIFYPTTLLAQCDSCIGSKSSINVGTYKNQVGTFYPPRKIIIDVNFLKTLDKSDILSGLGEAIKVHYLDPRETHKYIFDNYEKSLTDMDTLRKVIRKSLMIKKNIVEIDEYDKNYRNVMNYGHTFGHAIESVADYKIPHGIAVTIGMGLANYVSYKLGHAELSDYEKMEELIQKNIKDYEFNLIDPQDQEKYWKALQKDKKNIGNKVSFILTSGFGKMFRRRMELDENVRSLILEYLNK